MRFSVLVTLVASVTLVAGAANVGLAQDGPVPGDGPQFLAVASVPGRTPVRVDAGSVAILRRRLTIDLAGVPFSRALADIGREVGVEFAYSPEVLAGMGRVRLRAVRLTLAAVLTELLLDAKVDVLLMGRERITLVPRGGGAIARQQGAIAGRITDAKAGGGLSGVEVYLDKTRWRTTTDTGGRYRLAEVDSGKYTLVARRLGYERHTQSVTVVAEREDTVDLALTAVTTQLDELVTTVTGRQRRVELASDVTVLNADSIVRNEPITSVTDLLETRVPGLSVQRTSGAPGDPARLRLRGVSSPLRNNDPIVVIDGIRAYSEQSAARSGNLAGERGDSGIGRYATPSPLDYIDPNSIETIEVVKGPSAATLYGQDAANGVIVITTKKGKAGPPRWTASAEHGVSRIAGDYPNLLIRWGHTASSNQPQFCPVGNQLYGAVVSCQGDSIVSFQLLNDPTLTALDKGSRTGVTLGVSGGSSSLTYAITGSYQNEIGLPRLPSYEIERYRARLQNEPPDWMRRPQALKQWGVTTQFSARLGAKADVSLTSGLSRTDQQRSSLERQLGKLMAIYVDRASETYYQQGGDINNGNFTGVHMITDILNNYFERATAAATDFTNVANLSWRPHTWLTMTADAGINLIQRSDQLLLPRGDVIGTDSVGYVSYGHGTSLVSTINLRGNAVAPLGRGFQFRFAAGANYQGTSIGDLSTQTRDLPIGTSLLGSEILGVGPSELDNATFGWYVEPSVNNSRLFLTTGLRLDGGSSYGSGITLPKFPKLGFSYLLSDESFYPLKRLVPTFRLRVAYGQASRQPGPTDELRLYAAPQNVLGNGEPTTGVFLQTLGNTKLRPERTTELEGGFDADLLDSRLSLTVTGYRRTTEDALLNVPVPPSVYGSGVTVLQNIGVVRNTGLELQVRTQWVRSGAVNWGTELLVSQNRNVVVELGPGVLPFYTGSFFGSGLRVAPGYPLNSRWAKPILGYADANGNGMVDPAEILLGDTAIYTGSTLPNYEADLRTTLSFWNNALAISAGLQYQNGLSQRNEVAQNLSVFSRGLNDPTASPAEQANSSTVTDYNWIQTVNTVRFGSLSVSYSVPQGVARRLGASTLRVAVQGVNLGLWTNYRGLDPNVNAFGTGNDVIDTGVLPAPRTWQVRVNATY